MSVHVTLEVYQKEHLIFDSIDILNDELLIDGDHIDLLLEFEKTEFQNQHYGLLKIIDNELLFANKNACNLTEVYIKRIEVGHCFGTADARIISDHIKKGSLTLLLNVNGEKSYFMITPGSVEEINNVNSMSSLTIT